MDAMGRADLAAVADLLADDVRTAMPPWPMWFQGRDEVTASLRASKDTSSRNYGDRFRMLPTRANGHPETAGYVRGRDDAEYRPFAIAVLRVEVGRIAEITAFHDLALFPIFDQPMALPTQ